MCGITGFISSQFKKSHLQKMTDVIRHRGPDAEGYFFDENNNIGLGHRRLSIIDLSSTANQPVFSHCGRYTMVYNGEVYNYKEIADKLNRNWKTTSDTEVILEAFAEYGVNFVEQLNGMFAIAIWDKQKKELFIFRDRLGIKPLFYYWDGYDFLFGSEIKSIKKILPNLKIDEQTINHYLYLGYAPQESTFYKNVFKLPAGSIAIIKDNKVVIKKYWDLTSSFTPSPIKNIKTAKTELKELIFSSVEYRMLSDVPLGTFLSGGTDSSLITAIASKISNQKVNTFSIGFKENKFNESAYAKQIAKHLNTNHHEFIVSHTDALEILDKVMDNFDEPFADSSALPTYLVSQLAKKHISVALSGDGGDELFFGYGSYNWAQRLSKPMLWNSRKLISRALSITSNRNKRAAQVFNSPSKERVKSHIFSQEQYLFSEKELSQILTEPYFTGISLIENNPNSLNRTTTPIEEQALFDIQNYLKDDLLVKVDRASMLNSLEVRVPLLDHRIVEKSVQIHQNLKISKGVQKHILKETLYELVPKNLLDHPKWGFSIPLVKWLKTDLNYLIKQYLSKQTIEETEVLNYEYVQKIIQKFMSGQDYYYNRIWQLIILQKFLLKK